MRDTNKDEDIGIRFCRGQSVALVADEDQDESKPKWVQVAVEGEFKGYRGGKQPFAFTRSLFNEMVLNLRAHPGFTAGADGVGSSPVIPWDFHHASEMDPTSGTIPSEGTPAQGWTYDLQVRQSEDGKAQLWALTEFVEPARNYVKKGQYRWASVAACFDAVDPVTGENVGALITSIALTNTPFLEGMSELVAEKKENAALSRYFSAADNPTEAIKYLRDLFGLPATADLGQISAEIAKLRSWVDTGGAPVGVEIGDLISGMRQILNLPAVSVASDVFEAAEKIAMAVIENALIESGQPTPVFDEDEADETAESADLTVADDGDNGGLGMDLIKNLSKILGVDENEEAVTGAVENAVSLRNDAAKVLCSEQKGNDVLLEAADEAVAAKGKLSAILKALSVEDPDSAFSEIASLMKKAQELEDAMPELSALREKAVEAENKAIEDDVNEAMASRKLPDAVKDALVMLRRDNHEKFTADFPKLAADKANLTKDVAVKDGAPLKVDNVTPAAKPNGKETVNLSGYDGRNKNEAIISWLLENDNGAKTLDYDSLFKRAMQMKSRYNFEDSRA